MIRMDAERQAKDYARLKAKLKPLKTELKQWERQFESQHGRKPDKPDILAVHDIAKR